MQTYKNYFYSLLKLWMIFTILNVQSQEMYDITFDDSHYKGGIYSSGYSNGIYFRNGVNINKKLLRTYEINFGHIKHFKEKSILNQRIGNTTPYIFGKLNRLYVLRPMIGVSKTISEKKSKNNIGVVFFGGVGPLIGFLKPVYVDLDVFDTSGTNTSSTISVRYNPLTTPQNRILGYSSFGKGIEDTKIISGICFKSGISFDWGTYRSDFKSIELGIQLDYFPSRPKIMDEIKNKTIFSGFYISFAFGKNY